MGEVAALIRSLVKTLRMAEWLDKALVLLSLWMYLAIGHPAGEWLQPLASSTIFALLILSSGYALNSIGDRKHDLKAGKDNMPLGEKRTLAIAIFWIALSALSLLMFETIEAQAVGVLCIFFAIAYSLRPLRLKESAVWGVIAPALAQRPLLFLIFAFQIRGIDATEAWLTGWLLLLGLFAIFSHQLRDFANDRKTGVRTFAVAAGKQDVKLLLGMSLSATALVAIAGAWILGDAIGGALLLLLTAAAWARHARLF